MGCPQSKKGKLRVVGSDKEQRKLSKRALKKQNKAKAKMAKALAETKAKGDAELRAVALEVAGLGGVQLPAITSQQTPEQTPERTPEQTPEQTHKQTPEQTIEQTLADVEEILKEMLKEAKSPHGMMNTDTSVATVITDVVAKVITDDSALSKNEDLKATVEMTQSVLATERPTSSASVEPKLIIVDEANICVDNTVDKLRTATPETEALIKAAIITNIDDAATAAPVSVKEDAETKREDDKPADEITAAEHPSTSAPITEVKISSVDPVVEPERVPPAIKMDKQDSSCNLDLEASNLVKAVFTSLEEGEGGPLLPEVQVSDNTGKDAIETLSAADQEAILEQEAAYLVDAVFASLDGEDEEGSSTPVTDPSVGVSGEVPSTLEIEAAKFVSAVLASAIAKEQGKLQEDPQSMGETANTAPCSLDQEAAKLVDACLASITEEDSTAVGMPHDEIQQCNLDQQAADMVGAVLASITTEDHTIALSKVKSAATGATSSTASIDTVELTRIILNGLKQSSMSLVRPTSEMSTQTCEMSIQTDDIESEERASPSRKPSAVSKVKAAIKSASKRSRTALFGKKDKKSNGSDKDPKTNKKDSGKSKTKLADSKKPASDVKKSKSDRKKSTTADRKKSSTEPKGHTASSRMLKEAADGAKTKENSNTKASKIKEKHTSTISTASSSKSKENAPDKPKASKIPKKTSSKSSSSTTRSQPNPAEKLKASKSASFPRKGKQKLPNNSASAARTSDKKEGSQSANSLPADRQHPKQKSVANQPTTPCDNSAMKSKSSRKLKPGRVTFKPPKDIASSPSVNNQVLQATSVESKDANIALTSTNTPGLSKLGTKRQKHFGKGNVSITSEGTPRRANSAHQAHGPKTSVAALANSRPKTVMANQMDSTTLGPDGCAMGDNIEVIRDHSVTHQLSLEDQPLEDHQEDDPAAENQENQEQQLPDQLHDTDSSVLDNLTAKPDRDHLTGTRLDSPLGKGSPPVRTTDQQNHVLLTETDTDQVSRPNSQVRISNSSQGRASFIPRRKKTPSPMLLASNKPSRDLMNVSETNGLQDQRSACSRISESPQQDTASKLPRAKKTSSPMLQASNKPSGDILHSTAHLLNQQDRDHLTGAQLGSLLGKGSPTIRTTDQQNHDLLTEKETDQVSRPTTQIRISNSPQGRASLIPRGKKTPSPMLLASNKPSCDLLTAENRNRSACSSRASQIPSIRKTPSPMLIPSNKPTDDLLTRPEAGGPTQFSGSPCTKVSMGPQDRATQIPRVKMTPSPMLLAPNKPLDVVSIRSEAGGPTQDAGSPQARAPQIPRVKKTSSPMLLASNKPSDDPLTRPEAGGPIQDPGSPCTKVSMSPQARASQIPRVKMTPSPMMVASKMPLDDLLTRPEAGGPTQNPGSPCRKASMNPQARTSQIPKVKKTPSPMMVAPNETPSDLLGSTDHLIRDATSALEKQRRMKSRSTTPSTTPGCRTPVGGGGESPCQETAEVQLGCTQQQD